VRSATSHSICSDLFQVPRGTASSGMTFPRATTSNKPKEMARKINFINDNTKWISNTHYKDF
jgi:hypothetical protein